MRDDKSNSNRNTTKNTNTSNKEKQEKKAKLTTKIWVLLLSFIIAGTLYLNVAVSNDSLNKSFSFTNSSEGVYVIEDLDLQYTYDTSKYEVVSLSTEPYAVVRGDKALINVLKWTGNPEFYIDLTEKPPGTYREVVRFKGIDKNLQVEIYPSILDLRLMEQQTMKIVPTIEVVGQDNLDDDYIVSVPELMQQEVRIRDIQDKLNQVGSVKGVVDVSNINETSMFDVELQVFDRNGNVIPDINLIDKTIEVRVPIEEKVTVIEEKVIEEIVVVEEKKDEVTQEEDSPKESTKPTTSPKPTTPSTSIKPTKEGILSFINIPSDLEINHQTSNLKWSGDVTINLKGFKVGVYEMTVDDKGTKKTVKFALTPKHKEDSESPPPDKDDSSGDDSDPTDSTEPPKELPSENDSSNTSEGNTGGSKEPNNPSNTDTTLPSKDGTTEEKENTHN